MISGDYERYRRRLEQQLRADVELLVAAYRTKLRAYETVARTRGELEGQETAPPLAARALLEAAGMDPAAAGAGEAEGAGALAAVPEAAGGGAGAAPGTEGRPPADTDPAVRARSYAFEVYDAIAAALPELGKTFDRRDLCRALGYEPSRATLHRVLLDLQQSGMIAVDALGAGARPTRYRKASTPAPASGAGAES